MTSDEVRSELERQIATLEQQRNAQAEQKALIEAQLEQAKSNISFAVGGIQIARQLLSKLPPKPVEPAAKPEVKK